jgi:hypothetical protein
MFIIFYKNLILTLNNINIILNIYLYFLYIFIIK